MNGLWLVLSFQSTPSCRGRLGPAILPGRDHISIHALVQRAAVCHAERTKIAAFQSTPSCRGRHEQLFAPQGLHLISIHALVQRAARYRCGLSSCRKYFNPRPRAEGGEPDSVTGKVDGQFQSTPSCRGRRNDRRIPEGSMNFNPRPRAEGGAIIHQNGIYEVYFNPRPRAEGGLEKCSPLGLSANFNPRPRAEGGDFARNNITPAPKFQSTPSCRGRRGDGVIVAGEFTFQSTPSCRGRRYTTLLH